MSWIGVDLDGTLARYDPGQPGDFVGAPLPLMVQRVREALAAGREVRIMTARVSSQIPPDERAHQRAVVTNWCAIHLGTEVEVTAEKDYELEELWDDRARQVIKNVGVFREEEEDRASLALAVIKSQLEYQHDLNADRVRWEAVDHRWCSLSVNLSSVERELVTNDLAVLGWSAEWKQRPDGGWVATLTQMAKKCTNDEPAPSR